MIFIAAIIIISFAYLYNRLDLGSPTGQTYAFSMEGRKVRYDDAERIAKAALVVSEDLNRPELVQGLGAADVAGIVQNILILKREAKEFGIEATQDEIEDVIRNAPRFRASGRYDPNSFNTYLTEEVERGSIPRKLFYETVADTILYEKLNAVVTAGLVPTPVEIDLAYQRRYETLAASIVTLKRDDFASGIGISPAEIQTYFETHKDSLQSPERRQIEYVFLEQPKHPRILRQEQERANTPPSTPELAPEPLTPEPEPEPEPTATPTATPSPTPEPSPTVAPGPEPIPPGLTPSKPNRPRAAADRVKPRVRIDGFPVQRTPLAFVILNGTVTDNRGVRRVEIQAGGKRFVRSKGTQGSWYDLMELKPGANVFRVRAIDTSGNVSKTERVTVIREGF